MAKVILPANSTVFVGSFPEDMDAAKKWVADNGYTKADVRIYKKQSETPYTGSDPAYVGKKFTHINLLVDTIRPVAVDCCVIDCSNHTEKAQ